MIDLTTSGLYLVESGELHHVHTGNGQNIDLLRDYIEEWDLMEELTDE